MNALQLIRTHTNFCPERQKLILNGLSFTVEPGQKVAFVGQAGCGKSTAMDLLQRLYAPTGGKILVDGQPIGKYDPKHLRRHCGVVAQNNVLFDRSATRSDAHQHTHTYSTHTYTYIQR